MNCYATNTPEGFQFAGSFESVGQAMDNAARDGLNYTMWWADDEDDPEWGVMPNWVAVGAA